MSMPSLSAPSPSPSPPSLSGSAEAVELPRLRARLPRNLHKVIFLVHIAAAVGWLGVTSTFLVLTVSLLGRRDAATLRTGYAIHELIVTWLARPAALVTLGTGLVLALGTGWGRFRHWWVPAKLVLLVATVALTVTVSPTVLPYAVEHADTAGTPAYSDAQHTLVLMALYHVVMISTAAGLAVFKPGGRRRRPRPQGPAEAADHTADDSADRSGRAAVDVEASPVASPYSPRSGPEERLIEKGRQR